MASCKNLLFGLAGITVDGRPEDLSSVKVWRLGEGEPILHNSCFCLLRKGLLTFTERSKGTHESNPLGVFSQKSFGLSVKRGAGFSSALCFSTILLGVLIVQCSALAGGASHVVFMPRSV